LYGRDCTEGESIESRARQLLNDLERLDLSKPTILVGHSMGGLIIKSMLTLTELPSLRGIIFYSTPHHGSKLASLASTPIARKIILPSNDVTNLDTKSETLKKLNFEFKNFVENRKINVLSFYEKCPMKTFGKGTDYRFTRID